MADAGPADERLPWLDTPRPARKGPRAARPSRTPLLLLLALIAAATVAVMAFLAGRGSGPFATDQPADRAPPAVVVPLPAPQLVPAPAPVPEPPVAIPAPVAAMPAPAPAAEAAPERASAGRATPARPKAKRKASARRTAEQSRGVRIHRNRPHARATPQRYRWPVASAQPSGRVVQLGAYYSGRQTMAAWRRLRRAYPYLATLPRKVTVVRPGPGHPRYYRLRIGAKSDGHARAICDNLHRIGRGCIIV
jgi:hypothetical protein